MPRSSAATRLVNNQDPGKLDRLVELYGPLYAKDAVGSPSARQWVLIHGGDAAPLWAAVLEMPGQTVMRDNQERIVNTIRVKIRFIAEVNALWLVKYGERWFEIEAANEMGMRQEWKMLICREWQEAEPPVIGRATEDGDTRTTEAGDGRVLE